jgi:hypothetical protein
MLTSTQAETPRIGAGALQHIARNGEYIGWPLKRRDASEETAPDPLAIPGVIVRGGSVVAGAQSRGSCR